MRQIINTVAIALALTIGAAQAAEPLLMPGKQSLYQRVLVVPGGEMSTQPGAAGNDTTPFTAYYVYERTQHDGQEWLSVGTGQHGETQGWLPASDTLAWNQGLTVAFREAKGHDRALLFRDADALEAVTQDEQTKRYQELYEAAVAGVINENSPVVAVQPPGRLDIQEDFYLVPISEHKDIFVKGEQARMLQVASVPLKYQAAPKAASKSAKIAADSAYRAGLVFAIDATLSMDPYIQRTREAVRKIYDSLGQAELLGNVNFGLVAYQDNPSVAPGLDYLARTYVDLEQGRNPETFMRQIDTLKAANISSQDFVEDAYAGVKKAIDEMDWEGHAARYLVVITDAGPRPGSDPLSSTGLDAEALRQLAREKGIAIFVLHLLTPANISDHASAAATYRELSRFPGLGSLYYGVPTGDVNQFGRVLDTLAGQITLQVQMAGVGSAAQAGQLAQNAGAPATDDQALAELQSKVDRLGYALRMQYLQKTEGGQAPRLFNAWLLDRDIRNPQQRTLDIQVLLTRDQLSDLHDILRQVLQTAEEGLLSPRNFLNELQSLAATITRTPDQLGQTTATTAGEGNSLADLGFMREYIEDLPYTPEVMSLSLDDWESWPAREQIDFLHRLEDKINYYRALHDHTDLWVSLDGGPVDGDAVFPVSLEMLP